MLRDTVHFAILVCFIIASSGDHVATRLGSKIVWVSVVWVAPVVEAFAGEGWGGRGDEEQE
jgi:hypothetical protein